MLRHLSPITLVLLTAWTLQAAPVNIAPLKPTLPAPEATELQKLEKSLGLNTVGKARKPEPVREALVSKEDQNFLDKAAEMNIAEIQAGMAAEKSNDSDVKKLAQRLVRGHQTAQKQLEKLASSKGVALPTQPGKSAQEKLDSLRKKTGHEFDKQFLLDQVKGHQEAILFFEKEAKRTSDADIKAWTEHMISGLKSQLALAKGVHLEAVAEPAMKMPKMKQRVRKSISD